MPILPNDTLSSIVNLVDRASSDSVVQPPLSSATFTLDSSGVAGFFGGESSVRAMGTACLIPQRPWLGWYNAPGAYEVAKQYSGLAKSHLFNALFPGGARDPAKILMVDDQVGPECTPLYFPTRKASSSIGHLGSLIARKVSQMSAKRLPTLPKKNTMDTYRVAFVKLSRNLTDELNDLELVASSSIIFTVVTILISVGGCVACASIADWFCFASIALGIIANGVACSVIGSGKLYLKNEPSPQPDSPGDTLLKSDTDIIILVGNEGMVRPFTYGRFILHYGEKPSSTVEKEDKGDDEKRDHHNSIGSWFQRTLQKYLTVDTSVILLLFQFLAQLLLIPQGTLFGQLMFVGTLVPSWMYHSYLSTLGLDLQTRALFLKLSIQTDKDIYQYQLNSRMQAVVFACLVFRSIHPPPLLSNTTKAGEQTQEDTLKAEMAQDEAEDKKENEKVEKKKKLKAMKAALDAKDKADRIVADMAKAAKKAMDDKEMADHQVYVATVEVDKAEEKVERANEEEKKAAKKVFEEKKKDVGKKDREAKMMDVEKGRKDRLLKVAENEAKEAAKRVSTTEKEVEEVLKTEELKKTQEHRKEVERKEVDVKKEEEDNALQALLNALLPGQTEVLRVFKDSLVRKLGSANNDRDWANMEQNGTFEFNDGQDRFTTVQGGKSFRQLEKSDWQQLDKYRADAEEAFTAWKSVGRIA